MSKASNYILEHCIEKLTKINSSNFVLGFLVESGSSPSFINLNSEVFINTSQLTEGQSNILKNDLITHLFNGECPRQPLFFTQENQFVYTQLFKNKNINNFRYIPVIEGDELYAVVVLINIAFSSVTHALANVEPFILGSIALFKNRKQQNKMISSVFVDNPIREQNQNVVETLLQNTFHPTFIFNEDFEILAANAASQRLFNSNIDRGWSSMKRLIEKSMPTVSIRLLNTISKYFFLGHLDKREWLDIEFQQNLYQSIKVDIHLFELKYLNKQCFGLMLNEKLQSEITQESYYSSLQRFNALTSVVPMAILQVNQHWECSYVNETWERYTGQSNEDTLGKGWLSCLLDKNIETAFPNILREISHAKSYQNEVRLLTVNKNTLWVSVSVVGLFNEKFELTGLILTMNDISESRLHAEKLHKMATIDHLTGLSNRGFFNDRLGVALSRVARHGITAVMFLDLDRFKQINDTYGHPVGDKVIQEVAKRLKYAVREEDSISRLGGDEFAIIFTDVKDGNALSAIAKKIVTSIHLPFHLKNRTLRFSCSIGVAIAEAENTTPTEILKKADLALYKAKELGRNQFYFYDNSLETDVSMLNCLRDSLDNLKRGDFSLVFQPQINAKTNDIFGFEILSRWHHPTLGIVGPDVFIKIIEENNLMESFSDWLFYEAILKIKSWLEKGFLNNKQRIAINLSVKQLHLVDFADTLISLFLSQKVEPRNITLEVTETAFIQDPNIAGDNLYKLRQAGFFIALDDFGTGYSSLGLLRKMPLDYIKIDRSFIKDILYDDEAEKIVLAIIGLANMLKLGVIAEGVENEELKTWLLSHDSIFHQGYYYYKPLPEEEVVSLLSQNN